MVAKARLFVQPGQIFGRLTVIDPETRDARGTRAALCRCDCGRETFVNICKLLAGQQACNNHNGEHMAEYVKTAAGQTLMARLNNSPKRLTALVKANKDPERRSKIRKSWDNPGRREATAQRFTTHGLTRHPLYRTWVSMMHRCHNPEYYNYPGYGARGITVCTEWHDVRQFIAWTEANLGPRPPKQSLDRIDNDGNYQPGNVRWATASEQARNRRKPRRSPKPAATPAP